MIKGYLIDKYTNTCKGYTPSRLIAEAHALGMELEAVGIYDTYVTNNTGSKTAPVLYCNQTGLAPRDFCINRYKWGNLKDEINRLAGRSYNPIEAFNIYINKYEQVKRLKSAAFDIPKYILGTANLPYETLTDKLGSPFVAKGLESSMGEEILLINTKEEYASILKKYPVNKPFLFEEFISSSYGHDLRLYSVRGEAIAAMERESCGDFRANVALGAKTKAADITDDLRTIVRAIYNETGLDFLGIDLLFGEERYVFCEINVMPGIEGMESATGVNVARKIMETIRDDFND